MHRAQAMGDSAPRRQALPATLDATGAGRGERLRLHRIEALAARMSGLEGRARALLESRLQRLLQDVAPATPDDGSPPPTPAVGSGLAALTQLLAELRAGSASPARPEATRDVPGDRVSPPVGPPPPTLPALEVARQTWARLRMDDHLRHVMAEVPDDAGPMHSTVLVHRAIAVMHEAAPGYLQHFLGYADALAALERLCPAPAAAAPTRTPRSRASGSGGPAAAGARSRTRGKRRPQ